MYYHTKGNKTNLIVFQYNHSQFPVTFMHYDTVIRWE